MTTRVALSPTLDQDIPMSSTQGMTKDSNSESQHSTKRRSVLKSGMSAGCGSIGQCRAPCNQLALRLSALSERNIFGPGFASSTLLKSLAAGCRNQPSACAPLRVLIDSDCGMTMRAASLVTIACLGACQSDSCGSRTYSITSSVQSSRRASVDPKKVSRFPSE